MKRAFLLLVALSVIGGTVTCLLSDRTPKRGFEIQELLIDETAFPVGWSADLAGVGPVARGPIGYYKSIEDISLSFYVYNGSAGERIFRFRNAQGAAQGFERQLSISFQVRDIDTPWIVPAELPYQSSVADQFYFACSEQGGVPMCCAIGQYEEYLVYFNTIMSPDFMTYADLERVLQAIDERMAEHLNDK